MLSDGDELRVFNTTGEGGALPTVEGFAFVTFVHNILNQVATAGRDYLSSCVGSTEGSGEDFDRLCFVHGSNMAQIWSKIKGSCATLWTGFKRNALPLRSVENPQRNGAAVGTPNGGRSCLRYLRS